jgi:hypothetical protein
MRPSPLQSRFDVRFTMPLTTCPHAGFVDDAPAVNVVSCCCCGCSAPCCDADNSAPVITPRCCAVAGVVLVASMLNVNSVTITDAATMDEILRLPSSSILNQRNL